MTIPLVSILIPVYNRETLVGETIESAINQTYDNIEIIVVDNCSTDSTWKVLQEYKAKDKRLRIFRNETNLGPVRNWFRCVEEATGEYGKILWSDDLISTVFIEKCLPLFDDETAFVYSGVKIFTDIPENGELCYFIGQTGHRSTFEYITKALLGTNVPVSPGCAIFRLADLKNNLYIDIPNKINSDFSMHAIGNDLLIFLLTAKDYKKFGFVADSLSFFRAHPGSISISSSDGKLPLHYMLTKAYFAERYRKEMVNQVAANAWFLLKRYPAHLSFGIKTHKDFFYGNVKLNIFVVAIVLFKKILRFSFRIFRKNDLSN